MGFSPESLAPLWECGAAAELARRVPASADDSRSPVRGSTRPASLESPDQLSSWFHNPSEVGYERFSAETLWLVDGIGRYLGETAIRNIPGSGWRAGHGRRTGYAYQDQPVVGGLDPAQSRFNVCAVLALHALYAEPASLSDVFDQWMGRSQP